MIDRENVLLMNADGFYCNVLLLKWLPWGESAVMMTENSNFEVPELCGCLRDEQLSMTT